MIIWIILLSFFTSYSDANECVTDALKVLKKNYPRGFEILNSLEPAERKSMEGLIHCSGYQNTLISLSTVVHESVHFANAKKSRNGPPAFILTNDSMAFAALPEQFLAAISDKKLNLIHRSLSEVERTNGGYAESYLEGDIGNQDFFSLMDELDAYTNELDAAIHLPRLPKGNSQSELAGPLAMIVFVLRYYEYFEKSDADFFHMVLMGEALRPVVSLLIEQALNTVKEGRSISDLQFNIEIWEEVIQNEEHRRMIKLISLK